MLFLLLLLLPLLLFLLHFLLPHFLCLSRARCTHLYTQPNACMWSEVTSQMPKIKDNLSLARIGSITNVKLNSSRTCVAFASRVPIVSFQCNSAAHWHRNDEIQYKILTGILYTRYTVCCVLNQSRDWADRCQTSCRFMDSYASRWKNWNDTKKMSNDCVSYQRY